MTRAGELTRSVLLGPADWPRLGDVAVPHASRAIAYRGDRRIVAGVDERTGRITAYVAQRQDGPCRVWVTVLSTSSAGSAAEWLSDARLPSTSA